ncbi:MAG: AI-2E family transporter [Bacteroidetes bacterium]|jgi:predicted PurR-regulated permease PerM|nr:AI-2E family transporter [Bacteroidota bacterium]
MGNKDVLPTEKWSTVSGLAPKFLFALVAMYLGRSVLIPLCFSALLAFILYPICKWLEVRKIPRGIAIVLALLLITGILGGIVLLLITQIAEFASEWELLKEKLLLTANDLGNWIGVRFHLDYQEQADIIRSFIESSGNQAIPILKTTANSFTELLFFLIMIPLITALILYNRGLLSNALYAWFPQEQRNAIHQILLESVTAYYRFVRGMLLVYLTVGILNSIGLYFIGLPHPLLFGFIAAILTFIPYVGIMIASLLPITIAWVNYNSIWYPIAVIAVFATVQLLEAYLIFPFAVGNQIKINSLVVIVAILMGGLVWGAAGMILFIPLISIFKLIADRTEQLRPISILLGTYK